jgi:hypothetical protein
MKVNMVIGLLTPWCRAIVEKLIAAQLVKVFFVPYGNRILITVFRRPGHWIPS